MINPWNNYRLRIMRNPHGSAKKAARIWLRGSLWGNPIWLGPNKAHVYGAWKRKWQIVFVEFTDRRIVVLRKHPSCVRKGATDADL